MTLLSKDKLSIGASNWPSQIERRREIYREGDIERAFVYKNLLNRVGSISLKDTGK